ncbi:hypothetical protein VTO73DRAFT_6333 [Trametes versicolor]
MLSAHRLQRGLSIDIHHQRNDIHNLRYAKHWISSQHPPKRVYHLRGKWVVAGGHYTNATRSEGGGARSDSETDGGVRARRKIRPSGPAVSATAAQ